jgi:hypothetical protein
MAQEITVIKLERDNAQKDVKRLQLWLTETDLQFSNSAVENYDFF